MTRILVFSLFGFSALTIMGPLQDFLGMDIVVLDVPLIIVIYMAMADRSSGFGLVSRSGLRGARRDWSGAVTALLLGYLSDVLGAGIKGLHCFSLAAVFLLCRRAARQVYLAGTMSALLVTFTSSLGASVLGLAIRWITGTPPGVGSLTVAGVQALLCAVVSPLVIRLLRAVDMRLMHESADRGTMLP